jgi:hypothetical protein
MMALVMLCVLTVVALVPLTAAPTASVMASCNKGE